MTALLTQDEQEVGADVATVFLETVPESVARAGMLLALCLGIVPHDLTRLLHEIWPDTSDLDAAVKELSTWPFILRSDETWTMLESVAGPLAARLRESEPTRFRAAHEWLFALEESRRQEPEGDPDQGWFLRGRLAFYLSGFAPDRADGRFGEAFESAPILERTTCRIWLSDLVLRQASFLEEQARAPAFFLGYRYYVANDRPTAARYFDAVLETDQNDIYRAIALHLRALCDPIELDDKIDMLERSIELSRRLRLTMNQIMASHSLTWVWVQAARERDQAGDRNLTGTYLGRAVQLAERNAALAATTADESLHVWTRRTKAMTRWLLIVDSRSAARLVSVSVRPTYRSRPPS